MTVTSMIGNRYILHEEIGRGGMGAVYRASDLLTGQTVAIKRVTTPAEDLSFSTYPTAQGSEGTRIALAHEFEMLASLRHPNIISVLDYGFAELLENPQAGRVPYLSMDYLASGRTILEAAKGQTTARRVEMLVEALQALAYLHRRGIVHRDIKPGNILVEGPGSDNPGRVRVLDFGLSIQQETALGGEIAGTLIYLAPELIRRRSPQPPSPLSDLYAMGLIAYEMFAGRHPIEADSISQILLTISRERPDLSAIKAPPGIVAVIGRLLEKDPESRYPSAEATLIALSDAIDRPIPVETDAIRESYLQAATFVGREQELGSLLTALQAARQGRGSAFLIGGESGVGKSRLVAELRTRALVAGVTVLRGQAVGDSAQPFLVWRDPARILSLSQDIDPLTASVFKPVIPDIERLLGFDIPDAPDLGGAEDQARLQIALVRLLREMDEPALLVLEDLHWATPESLEALKRVVTVAEGLPLLVVGTFRDDEAPDLPGRLPGMEVIGLNRLSSDEIAMLSGAMLGSSGRDPQVLDLLRKETEGNAFFLVEVVRALAEEAGSLRDVAAMTLPVSVFAEGIQTIVRRRLERVPPPHDLLRLLAIAGRRVNPALIDRLAPDLDRDAWLAASANAAVLEQNAGQWQFAHDKLREQLLADLGEDERPTLHRRVAEAIEALHPGDATRAGQLADLWGAAGETERERQYSITAARSAAATGFYQEAVPRFNRAVTLTPQAQRADLLVGLGQAQLGISQYDAAETNLMAALGLLPADSPLVAQALTTLGMVHGSRGEYDEAAARYQEAIASAQRPQDAIRARIGLAKTAITQGDLETGQALAQDALEAAPDHPTLQADALDSLALVADKLGDMHTALAHYEKALAIHEALGARDEVAAMLNMIATVYSKRYKLEEAMRYGERALTIQREVGDPGRLGAVLVNLGVTTKKAGDYERALGYYQEARAIFKRIGHRLGHAIAWMNIGTVTELLGRDLESHAAFDHALRIAQEMDMVPLYLYVLLGKATLAAKAGDHVRAAEMAGTVMEHGQKDEDVMNQIRALIDERITLPEAAREAALKRGRDRSPQEAVDLLQTTT